MQWMNTLPITLSTRCGHASTDATTGEQKQKLLVLDAESTSCWEERGLHPVWLQRIASVLALYFSEERKIIVGRDIDMVTTAFFTIHNVLSKLIAAVRTHRVFSGKHLVFLTSEVTNPCNTCLLVFPRSSEEEVEASPVLQSDAPNSTKCIKRERLGYIGGDGEVRAQ